MMPMGTEPALPKVFSRRMRKSLLNILAFLGGAVLLSLVTLFHTGRLNAAFPVETSLVLLSGGLGGVFALRWFVQRRKSREREANLLMVVRTMRRIHLRLAERKSRDELLQGICRILVEEGHYFSAWLALIDREGNLPNTVWANGFSRRARA